MLKRRIIIVVIILFITAAGYFTMEYLNSLKEPPLEKPQQEQKRFVNTATVIYEHTNVYVEATGRLASLQYVDISSEVQGKILAGNIHFKKGQSFKKGDLLVRIYDKEAYFNLQSRKSRFLTSIANILPDFKVDFSENYAKWVDFFNSIDIKKPLPDLPKVNSNQEKIFLASRNILSDYYSIQSEEERFKKYSIYAPFDGSFTQVYLEVGAVANPGSRLANIIRTDKLELEIPLEIKNISWISLGDKVKVVSHEGKEWTGIVVRISDFVDPGTQSINVFVSLEPSKNNPLYQGQYLKALFPGGHIENTMVMPRNAVFNVDQVFIVKDSLLKKRTIDIHKINQETIIFSGLEEETEVVVEPLINAIENSKIIIIK